MSRTAKVERSTKESDVLVMLDVDGSGASKNGTPVSIFDTPVPSTARVSAMSVSAVLRLTVAMRWEVPVAMLRGCRGGRASRRPCRR